MPFKSEAQRRYLWKFEPQIAEKWAHGEHSTKNGPHRMPKRSSKRKSKRK